MGRIVTTVTITNALDTEKHLVVNVLVDTGATFLTLPLRDRAALGRLEERLMNCHVADGAVRPLTVCGPVRISVDGFPSAFGEVAFLESQGVEPLLGYMAMEAAGIGVDMLNHRLFKVDACDLK